MKTQVKLLDLAKQGDLDALVTLINQPLEHKGIVASAGLARGCLTITAESPTIAPTKLFFVDFVKQGINTLKPAGIERVIVRGRTKEDSQIVWRDHFSVEPPPQAAPSSMRNPSPKPEAAPQPERLQRPRPNAMGFLWASSFLLGALLTASIVGWFMPQRIARTQWEYRIVSIEDVDFNQALVGLGKDGWELAYARRAIAEEGQVEYSLYEVILKRPTSRLK
ncbi:MAG: hypothetical protein HC857_05040 [Synechococcales cyanobacterium RU_4_20]|nr:hypothetical protein [Synechococcales cyanobacterium RU_4_20]